MSAPTQAASRWHRIRGAGAVFVVITFFGTAVVAPFAMPPSASAEEVFFATRNDRLNQEFVPEEAGDLPIDLGISPLEEKPKPKPKPKPTPEPESEEEVAAEETATEQSEPAADAAAPKYSGGGSPAEWMAAAGIPKGDWGYVDFIASKESGWNPNATNPSSGACGLIQANPCSKVPGGGYDPVANLTWAQGYAVGRYGSWAEAYSFWTANHWW